MRRRGSLFLSLGVLLSAAITAPAQQEVLPYRIWQFHHAKWEYLQQAIPQAAEAGMNRIQLSHNIVMDAEQLWQGDKAETEWRQSLVQHSIELAHQHDMKVDMWTHEISGLPEGKFRNDKGQVVISEELWDWVRDKYERVFKLVPGLDGLVLTFSETDYAVFGGGAASDLTPPQRIARLIEVMAEVCAKHDKKLFFRTFVYEPEEIGFLEAAMEEAAKVNERTNNLIVMTKCVPHDWTPYYPFNPVLGKTAGLPQIVEIDLGQEFTGKSKILHCEVDYVKYVMDYSREHGLVGGVARVERKNHLTLGTPNEVNIHAFSRLLHDPDLTKDQLWEEWITKTYGSDVGEYLVPALRRTYDITNITLFPLEQWISNHSLLPDWHYAYGHITSRQNYKWLVTPHQARMRDSLLHPTADTLLKIDHEKDLARELAERSLADLEKVKDKLSPTAYQPLKHYLKLGRDCVEVFREQQLAMFATVRYMNAEESGEVSEDELAQFKSVAEEHIKKLRKWADKMEARYGGGVIPGNPGRARHFANQCEKRLGG